MPRFADLCRAVRARMPVKRYRHTMSVARTAELLAAHHGVSTSRARLAGLLHDVARSLSGAELLAYAHEHNLPVSAEEAAAPLLLHAAVGADIARREYGMDDPDVLAAITTHTVAERGMSDLQKVVHLADSFEPCRSFSSREQIQRAAYRSLDEGMLACIAASIEYLTSRGVPVAARTSHLYDDLVRLHGAKT